MGKHSGVATRTAAPNVPPLHQADVARVDDPAADSFASFRWLQGVSRESQGCAVGRITISPTSTLSGCSIAKAIAPATATGGSPIFFMAVAV